MQPATPHTYDQAQLLTAARAHVAALSLQYQDARRVLHDDRLGSFLEQTVLAFGQAEGTAADAVLVARLGALFYPAGSRINDRQPGTAAREAARQWLESQAQNALVAPVTACLAEVFQHQPQSPAANLLHDALVGIYTDEPPHHWASLHELELALVAGTADRQGQAQLRLQELQGIRYTTNAGRQRWQGLVGQQMLEQKKRLDKLRRDQGLAMATDTNGPPLPFGKMEADIPIRTAQTYFRVVYRNHINLSAIADNKANIMISVNAILISVLITFLSYRNIAETQPMILLPVVIFLVTGLASLIFAVLSARPKVTRLSESKTGSGRPGSGLAFFGNFVELSLPAYETAMDELLQDGSQLIGSMVEDLYHLGKVLDKKYRYLSIAYNIFMVGLVVTVALFLFTLLAS